MDELIVVTFPANLGDYLSFHVLRYTHPESTDFWDGNWVNMRVNIVVGDFKADVTADIRLDELVEFLTQLRSVHEQQRGIARFRSMEGWLEIDIDINAKGSGTISGMTKDSYARTQENSLKYTLKFERIDLSAPIKQLEATIGRFPIRGHR